jgi:hypothetical protein
VNMLRAWRLIAAAVRGGREESGRIIDEMDDCVCCLRIMVTTLAATTATNVVALAECDKAVAIALAEEQIGDFVKAARQQL